MRKYVVEFIGTFFLVFTIGCTGLPTGGALAPLAIGSILMTMIFAGGHISGAHYNPAVTIAVWIRGKCSTADVPGYILAQCVGGVLAAFTAVYLRGQPANAAGALDLPHALLAEFIFTFALCFVVLNVATAKATAGNSFYGLAIGFTVLAGAIAVGPVSGGVFNPAVAVGITIMKLATFSNLWIYLTAQFAAAVVAGIVFRGLNPGE